MKKIVILGGGSFQVPLIQAAKSCGYYVILCDFRENIPGKNISDVHYQVDTLKYDDIIDVCVKEHPDGIVTNSEPAVLNCTRVANELNLVSNSIDAIKSLMSKHIFRKIQRKSGCFSPMSFVASSFHELEKNINELTFPVIIKPSENSGTRGTRKIIGYDRNILREAYDECRKFSYNKLVEVEEYVEMTSLITIEGEIFVHHGVILWEGLFSTLRSSALPMVPMTYMAPMIIKDEDFQKIKEAIEKILFELNIKEGEFNMEGYFNSRGEFFVIEINARQGGLFLPDFVYRSTGIDYYKLLVTTSVNDESYWNELETFNKLKKNITNHAVFSMADGVYDRLCIDNSIHKYVVNTIEFVKQGDVLRKAENSTDIVALVQLEFSTFDEQNEYSMQLEKLITPKYKI